MPTAQINIVEGRPLILHSSEIEVYQKCLTLNATHLFNQDLR